MGLGGRIRGAAVRARALDLLRIEAGLLLLDVDFANAGSPGPTRTARHRSSSAGLDGPRPGADDRAFIGRRAIERELADGTSRWRMTGLVVDWQDYDRIYNAAGLIPPKDHTPIQEEMFVYDDDTPGRLRHELMYSPMLQRHIAMARVRPELAGPGRRPPGGRREPPLRVRTARTARLPLYNPGRKTA